MIGAKKFKWLTWHWLHSWWPYCYRSYFHERDEHLAGSEQINYDCVNSVTAEL